MLELRLAISLVPSSVRLLLLNYKPSLLAVLNMLSPVNQHGATFYASVPTTDRTTVRGAYLS